MFRIPKLVIEIISFLLVFLFVYAACSKLLDYKLFENQLKLSPWINSFSEQLAVGIPIMELVIACLIVVPVSRTIGLYLFAGSMIVFTIYIILVLNSGLHIPCSCGGLIQHLSWPQHIAFNTAFVVLAVIALYLQLKPKHRLDHTERSISYSS